MATVKVNIQTSWKVRRAIAAGLDVLGSRIVKNLRSDLNVPYPPASDPGEAPHKRSGDLRNSVNYSMNQKTLKLVIFCDEKLAEYWKYLEYGTKKMAARPFIRPRMKTMKPNMAKIVVKTARAHLK